MADPKAIALLEQIYARVDQQVREIVTSMLPDITIAAQDDGSVVANNHRILNFQGAGVTVSDDPARRRVNVFVPGAPTASLTSTVLASSIAAKGLSLWTGTTNSAPPANWQTPGYSDAAWAATVVATVQTGGDVVSGTSAIWPTAHPANNAEQALTRQTFVVPAGTISGATLEVNADDRFTAMYLNGAAVPGLSSAVYPAAHQTLAISPSQLIAGGTNLLACWAANVAPSHAMVTYKLLVSYGEAGTDTRYQLLAEKGIANGYAGLNASAHVSTAQLGGGTADSTTYLRGDGSWATPTAVDSALRTYIRTIMAVLDPGGPPPP